MRIVVKIFGVLCFLIGVFMLELGIESAYVCYDYGPLAWKQTVNILGVGIIYTLTGIFLFRSKK